MKKISRSLFIFSLLASAASSHHLTLFAAPTLSETPAHASVTKVGTFGTQSFGNPSGVQGGVAVEVDVLGNHYQASGSRVSKFNAGGVLQWSQSHATYIQEIIEGELTQFYYHDRWTDDHGHFVHIQIGSGYDAGQQAGLYAQKIVLDSVGDIYVNFLDLFHRDLSVLAKFDGATGVVEWVARSAAPSLSEISSAFLSKAIDLVVLPDQSVALLETGNGGGLTSHYTFTRLIIFASEGTISQRGVQLVTHERVRRNDGGPNQRMSVGVGLVVAPDGSLIYATFEGDAPSPLPAFGAPYPAPDRLVIRKLPHPYTGTPAEVVHDTPEVKMWGDLAIGPGGTVYALGTVEPTNQRKHPILAGFHPGTLAETMVPRQTYPNTNWLQVYWNIPGIKLFATGTGGDDALYLTSGQPDFRYNPDLSKGSTSWAADYPGQLAVTKVNSIGSILWQKHEFTESIYDAFIDDSDNVYLLGENKESHGVGIFKYSPTGSLQLADYVDSDNGRNVQGKFTGTINAAGNIVVALPQRIPGDPYLSFASPINLYSNPANTEPSIPWIDFPEFSSSAYPGEVLTLSATASDGGLVSFQITSGEDIAYIAADGVSLVLHGTGLVSVRAYQFKGGGFLVSDVRTLAIYKRPQTITFSMSGSQKFKKNKKFTLSASSTSNLPITFTSSNATTIKIAGNKAIILKKGKATITASQAGDTIYRSATPVSRVVKVK